MPVSQAISDKIRKYRLNFNPRTSLNVVFFCNNSCAIINKLVKIKIHGSDISKHDKFHYCKA